MNKHLLILYISLAAPSVFVYGQSKFVALGHIRDMAPNHENILDSLATRINAENPDYILLLGDITYDGKAEHWEMIDRFLAKLEGQVISAPGNHDVTQPTLGEPHDRVLRNYTKRFGYLYLTLETEDATFISINSCDSTLVINNYLRLKLASVDTTKPVFLLSHYRLWEDYKVKRSKYPGFSDEWFYLSNKSFDWEDLLPVIQGKVDHIIAGDHTLSWKADIVDGIHVYPVGTGSPGSNQPVLYFTGDIDSVGNVKMVRHDIALSEGDSWNTDKDDFIAMYEEEERQKLAGIPIYYRVILKMKKSVARMHVNRTSLLMFGLLSGLLGILLLLGLTSLWKKVSNRFSKER